MCSCWPRDLLGAAQPLASTVFSTRDRATVSHLARAGGCCGEKGLGAGGARAQPLCKTAVLPGSVSFPEGGPMLSPAELVGHTGDSPRATSKLSPPLPSLLLQARLPSPTSPRSSYLSA